MNIENLQISHKDMEWKKFKRKAWVGFLYFLVVGALIFMAIVVFRFMFIVWLFAVEVMLTPTV